MPVKMKTPEGMTGCSFGGEEFEVESGHVTVPQEAVGDLMCHGLVVVESVFTDEDATREANYVAEKKAVAINDLEVAIAELKTKYAEEKNDDTRLVIANLLAQKTDELDALIDG